VDRELGDPEGCGPGTRGLSRCGGWMPCGAGATVGAELAAGAVALSGGSALAVGAATLVVGSTLGAGTDTDAAALAAVAAVLCLCASRLRAAICTSSTAAIVPAAAQIVHIGRRLPAASSLLAAGFSTGSAASAGSTAALGSVLLSIAPALAAPSLAHGLGALTRFGAVSTGATGALRVVPGTVGSSSGALDPPGAVGKSSEDRPSRRLRSASAMALSSSGLFIASR
jgi:hypothetical protein